MELTEITSRPGVVFRVDWTDEVGLPIDTWYYPANRLPAGIPCVSREQAERLADEGNSRLEQEFGADTGDCIAWYAVAVNVLDPEEVVLVLACEYDGYAWSYEQAFARSRFDRPTALRLPSRAAVLAGAR